MTVWAATFYLILHSIIGTRLLVADAASLQMHHSLEIFLLLISDYDARLFKAFNQIWDNDAYYF